MASPGTPRYQDLTRFRLPPGFRGRSAVTVQLWWIVQATLFRGSPQIFYGWRRFLLRLFGARIGRNVLFRPSAKITYPWKLTVGDYSWIGDDSLLYSLDRIDIGSNVAISQRAYICAGSHDSTRIGFDMTSSPVRIGDECWISSDVFIAPGVTVGDGTVVGARSTVLCSLPGSMVCYGNPARPVRPRTRDDTGAS
jgi:putative colanic acid biosynthesis acetyltransferase WcaF